MAEIFLKREDNRFSIDTVTSGSEGIKRLDQAEYGCIVTDYDMPGQDAINFLKTVREWHSDLPPTPFTGKGSGEIVKEAISTSVTDYLQKGADPSKYSVVVNHITTFQTAHQSRLADDSRTDQQRVSG